MARTSTKTNSNETPETENESSRSKVSTFTYVNEAGEETKQVKSDSVGLRVRFANGYEDQVTLTQIANVLNEAALQGLAIKLQRSFASAKADVSAAIESYETVRDNLLAGVWAVKGEGSAPRLTILAEAVAAVLTFAGRDVDMKAIAEKLTNDEFSEKVMKDPKVKAQYDSIKAARAAERAAKSLAAAESAESDVSSLF